MVLSTEISTKKKKKYSSSVNLMYDRVSIESVPEHFQSHNVDK